MTFYPRGTIPESLEIGVFYQTVKERSGLKTPREIDQYLKVNAGPRYPELSLLAYGKWYSWVEFISKFGDFDFDDNDTFMIFFRKDNYESDWTDFIKELARGSSTYNDQINELTDQLMTDIPSCDQALVAPVAPATPVEDNSADLNSVLDLIPPSYGISDVYNIVTNIRKRLIISSEFSNCERGFFIKGRYEFELPTFVIKKLEECFDENIPGTLTSNIPIIPVSNITSGDRNINNNDFREYRSYHKRSDLHLVNLVRRSDYGFHFENHLSSTFLYQQQNDKFETHRYLIIFDIETNYASDGIGPISERVSAINEISWIIVDCFDGKEILSKKFEGINIKDGLDDLNNDIIRYDAVITGYNICEFDLRVIIRLYPNSELGKMIRSYPGNKFYLKSIPTADLLTITIYRGFKKSKTGGCKLENLLKRFVPGYTEQKHESLQDCRDTLMWLKRLQTITDEEINEYNNIQPLPKFRYSVDNGDWKTASNIKDIYYQLESDNVFGTYPVPSEYVLTNILNGKRSKLTNGFRYSDRILIEAL